MAAPVDLSDDAAVLAALRSGDERVFMALVEDWHRSMLRVARSYVPTPAVAEEVVQDTWLGVLNGLQRFEGRSALKTWVYSILVNQAKTRGARERRSLPFSALAAGEASSDEASVDADRFQGPGDPAPRSWAAPPVPWPEERLAERETQRVVQRAIDGLPPAQRAVITLRDVEGYPSEEVAELLGVSAGNQRVLLHRARSKVRDALEREGSLT